MPSEPQASPGSNKRNLYRNITLSVLAPLVTVQLMLHSGRSPITALSVAAVFPIIEMIIETLQNKRVGIIALVSFIGVVAGLGLSFATGNPLFALLKDSAFTGIFGLAFLGSLALGKPLIYQLNLDMAGRDPVARARAVALWEKPHVRRVMSIMTVVWGIGLLCEALSRVIVGLSLPLVTATSLSPIIQAVFIGGLGVWTVLYMKSRQRAAAALGI